MTYQLDIPSSATGVSVTATAAETRARLTVSQDGGAAVALASGVASAELAVPPPGATSVVTVDVTSADGGSTRSYKMLWQLLPPASQDATLGALTLSAGVLQPPFSGTVTAYAATVPEGIETVTLRARTSDAGATVSVAQDGGAAQVVASGAVSPPFTTPAVGVTSTVTLDVLAADGSTAQTYSVALTRGSASTGTPNPADRSDGWASYQAPASPGGCGATPDHVFTVHSRSELVNALNLGGATASNVPKIIYVAGTIDLSVDDADVPLDGWDYLDWAGWGGAFPTYESFRDAFAAGCSTTGVDPTLESTRAAAQARQKAVVAVTVGSNTSILGIGSTAVIEHGQLTLKGVDNVVIRNLAVLDAYDYFPIWDTSELLFNSEYDNIHVEGATHVWVDHCELGDGDRPDDTLPSYVIAGATKKWVTHDGALDITNQASYVTVSYSYVHDHDKTHLVGSSDTRTSDTGYLKTTFHHDHFARVRQRLPRVRFGQVHVYNNDYEQIGSYAIGVGVSARIYSEANFFDQVARPVSTSFSTDNDPGYCYDVGSVGVSGANGSAQQVGWVPSAAYPYTADAAGDARASTLVNAGVSKF
jgi:pectate lyase